MNIINSLHRTHDGGIITIRPGKKPTPAHNGHVEVEFHGPLSSSPFAAHKMAIDPRSRGTANGTRGVLRWSTAGRRALHDGDRETVTPHEVARAIHGPGVTEAQKSEIHNHMVSIQGHSS
jgi:hypothetical protein